MELLNAHERYKESPSFTFIRRLSLGMYGAAGTKKKPVALLKFECKRNFFSEQEFGT